MFLRRLLLISGFTFLPVLTACTDLPLQSEVTTGEPLDVMTLCDAEPQCWPWIDAVAAQQRALAEWYAALNLAVWYDALVRSEDPCNDDWPIPAYIVRRESGCRWDARNPHSSAGGAFQMIQSTADNAARAIGHPELVDVNAAEWPPYLQELAAAELWQGGAGSGHWAQTR